MLAQFDYGTDLDEATATIEENLRTATLPQSVEPTVGSFNFNAAPVVVASVSALGETDLEAAAEIARNEIIPELQAIPGVASADLAGGLEDRLVITLDPRAMAEAGVSMQQAIGVLPGEQHHDPGGELPTDDARIPVSTIGRFDTIEEIEGLVVGVARPSTAPIPSARRQLPSGVRRVRRARRPGRADAGHDRRHRHGRDPEPGDDRLRPDERPARGDDLGQQDTAPTPSPSPGRPGEARRDRGAASRRRSTIETVADQSVFILESSEGLLREGGLGAIFAVLTIFAFLLNVRSTFVAAVSIPLSILTALVIMQFAGITLNILTLGGLAVAVGRVVDDSIVVLENIFRHRALGDERWKAVTDGTARGGRRDHREHADDRRGIPAARLRRWLRQPVLPRVLADRSRSRCSPRSSSR